MLHVRPSGAWVNDWLSPSVRTTHARRPIPSEKKPRSSSVSASRDVATIAMPPPRRGGGDSISTEWAITAANEARSGEGNEYGRTRSVSPATPEGTFPTAARSRSTAARARSSLVGALGDDAASIERETSTMKTTSESARTERSPASSTGRAVATASARQAITAAAVAGAARVESGTSPTARATWRDRWAETTAATSGKIATSPTRPAHGSSKEIRPTSTIQYPVPGGEEPAPPGPPGARPPGGMRMPTTTRMRRSFSRFRFAFTLVGSATIADWNRPSAASTLPSVAARTPRRSFARDARPACRSPPRRRASRRRARGRLPAIRSRRDRTGCTRLRRRREPRA